MLQTDGEHFYRKLSYRDDVVLLNKEKLTKILTKEWVIIIFASTCHICVHCDGEKKKQAMLLLTCMDIIWEMQFFFGFFPFNSSIKQQIPRPECVTCSAPFGIKIATTQHNG